MANHTFGHAVHPVDFEFNLEMTCKRLELAHGYGLCHVSYLQENSEAIKEKNLHHQCFKRLAITENGKYCNCY